SGPAGVRMEQRDTATISGNTSHWWTKVLSSSINNGKASSVVRHSPCMVLTLRVIACISVIQPSKLERDSQFGRL
ncbi:MAG: hypothetical protein M0P13_09225, partial [Fibrobacteraceae bacterium]|nr:hypothetical protein [Fibrobacteraceae bacterium]